MKRTNLRRAVSGVLSVAMIASALFSDFSVPTNVFAADDTSASESSLESYSEGDGSITSDYIVENLNESLGEEAAALNEDAAYTVAEEYLVSEITETETDDSVENETDTTDDLVSVSGNDVGTSSNDVAVLNLDEADTIPVEFDTDSEAVVSEEEVVALAEEIIESANDISTATEYDENGLALTYHYITLNYSLVEEDLIWDGITTADIWDDVPDAFIAAYLTSVNVYAIEGNEDYYVAFINPASLNGLGSAIYADFTDLDTENPTVYNDIITFDTETGLVYIPKSFYFDENGEETIKGLEAQVLVPYSFDSAISSVSVYVSSEIDGVEGISGTVSVPTLDVTMTIQIVDAEDADKISLDDISLTVNDDMLPFDTTGENAYYDNETGELTISASANNIYSVNVTIAENVAEETLAYIEQRELLVASVGDLSGILVADTGFTDEAYKATDAENMNSLSSKGVTVTLEDGKVVAGQTMTYTASWAVDTSGSNVSTSTIASIVNNTATYSYYAQNSTGGVVEVTDSNWSQFFDSSGTVSLPGTSSAYYLLRAIDASHKSSTYNRIVSLPNDDEITSTSYGGSTSTTSWTTNISGNPSGYETYVAIHCVENGEGTATGDVYGTSSVTMRVLYAYEDSNGDGYFVFSLRIPKSYSQSGCGVYKVNYSSNEDTEYTARFGIKKVDADDNSTQLAATFAYYVGTSINDNGVEYVLNIFDNYAEAYENGEITETSLRSVLTTDGRDIYYSATSGTTIKSLTSSNSTVLANYDESDGNIYVVVAEIIPPDNYVRKEGLWVLEITPGKKVNGVTVSSSKLVSATHYYLNSSNTLISETAEIVSGSSTTFIIEEDEKTEFYGALNLAKTEYGTGSYVGGAVYALVDYTSTSYGNTILSYAETASEAGSASAAISSFYSSMKSAGDTGYLEGVYTTSSSGSVRLKSVTSSGTVGSDKILDFGSSTSKAYILVEIYSPSGYTLDDEYYAFVLYSTNTTEDYATALKATKMVYSLHNASDLTFSGNSTTANLVVTAVDVAYTSHTVTKVLSGTVTNDLVQMITVQLYRSTDGGSTYSATGYTTTLNDANDWSYTWEQLPKYNSSGVEYKYKAVEVLVVMYNQYDTGSAMYSVSSTDLDFYDYTGSQITYSISETSATYVDSLGDEYTVDGSTLVKLFEPSYSSDGKTVTNYYQTVDYTVEKDLSGTLANTLIKSVTVRLYRNGVATDKTYTLNSTNGWSYTWKELDKYDSSGNEYEYTAQEEEVVMNDQFFSGSAYGKSSTGMTASQEHTSMRQRK